MGYTGGHGGEITSFGSVQTGYLFTAIGDIPESEIEQDGASPNQGLADVDPNVAQWFSIPAYKDAPFGGNLRIRGLFGGDYLRGYRLLYHYGKNKSDMIKQEFYNTGISTAPYWYGVVEKEINSSTDAPSLQWKTCAYQFHLQAWDRRTNGEYYLGYKAFRDHYYIEVCFVALQSILL